MRTVRDLLTQWRWIIDLVKPPGHVSAYPSSLSPLLLVSLPRLPVPQFTDPLHPPRPHAAAGHGHSLRLIALDSCITGITIISLMASTIVSLMYRILSWLAGILCSYVARPANAPTVVLLFFRALSRSTLLLASRLASLALLPSSSYLTLGLRSLPCFPAPLCSLLFSLSFSCLLMLTRLIPLLPRSPSRFTRSSGSLPFPALAHFARSLPFSSLRSLGYSPTMQPRPPNLPLLLLIRAHPKLSRITTPPHQQRLSRPRVLVWGGGEREDR